MNEPIRSFASDFEQIVKENSDNVALVVKKDLEVIEISYKKLSDYVERYLEMFQKFGLEPGDTILSIMPNSAEAFITFISAMKGGFSFAPLSCASSKDEIINWINLVKPSLCLITDLITDDVKQITKNSNFPTVYCHIDCYFDFLPQKRKKYVSISDKIPLVFLSTSGTTGKPKAIVLDGNKLWSSGCAFMKFFGLLEGASLRFWNYLPMSYLGGLFNLGLIPLLLGASIFIDEPFSGRTFLDFRQTVDHFNINTLWLIPTIIRGLLSFAERMEMNQRLFYANKIQYCFLGTSPISLQLKQKFESVFGVRLFENFGLSETTFLTSENFKNIQCRKEGSVGEVLPYVSLKFKPTHKENQKALMEICVRSPFMFLGYLQEDGSLNKPFDNEGYFSTGDLGFLNEDNILIINGRERDIIKKGGLLVSLREMEVLTELHESVKEAAAVKISHDFYGESFILYVELYDHCFSTTHYEIFEWIRNKAAKYKWPENVLVVKKIPKTSTGKICKHFFVDNREGK